jgi:hypothetical protein
MTVQPSASFNSNDVRMVAGKIFFRLSQLSVLVTGMILKTSGVALVSQQVQVSS